MTAAAKANPFAAPLCGARRRRTKELEPVVVRYFECWNGLFHDAWNAPSFYFGYFEGLESLRERVQRLYPGREVSMVKVPWGEGLAAIS